MSLNIGHVRSKTRLLGQILEKTMCTLQKPYFQSDTCETLSETLMKSWTSVKIGPVKNEVTRSNLRKTLAML